MSLPKILVFSITLNSFCHPLCVIYVLFRDRSFFMGGGGGGGGFWGGASKNFRA